MKCNKIATGVHHVIKNDEKISSFFIAEGDYWEALESVGELYLNQHDMHYFLTWASGADRVEEDPQVLLISLDGKYGLIRRFSEIRRWNIDASIHEFLFDDDVAFGGYREFKWALDRAVANDPFLIEKLQLPKPRNSAIPERLKIANMFGRSLESFGGQIREAYQNPQWAKPDALIFAFLARENWQLRPEPGQVHEVEYSLRDQLGMGGELHHDGLYDAEGLTFKEIEKRRNRAIRNRNAFWRKFPDPREIEHAGGMDAVVRHTSKLTDDELFEILKETLCDMYLLSKCEKVYRISNWFSAFLSFSCLYNQTNVSNKLRYYPEYPIVPL